MSETFVTIASVLLTAFFLFACVVKILGLPKAIFDIQLEFFRNYGLNRNVMALVGFIELFGAIALWLPGNMRLLGALALMSTSAGAIYFHLRFDTWKDGIPAAITLLLSGAVLYSSLS